MSKYITIVPKTPEGVTEIHYVLVLDKSGSMESCTDATIEGFNSQLDNIKELEKEFPDQKYLVTLTTFNGNITNDLSCESTSTVSNLTRETYRPNGGTALYDAIGSAVTNMKDRVYSTSTGRAVIVIITDGDENSSRDPRFNSSEKIASLLEGLKPDGRWTVVFVGANQDAVLTAKSFNISSSNTMNFASNDAGTRSAFLTLNKSIKAYSTSYNDMSASGTLNCMDLSDNFISDDTK